MSLFRPHYSETHRIDDWEHPWLPAPIKLFNHIPDRSAKKWFSLDEKSLLNAARKKAALDNFGDDDFLEPFRLLLSDINNSNNFTAMGRLTARTILIQQLQSRLCVENRLEHNPKILSEKITSPIIIAGLPRTGTTHLHNLLSEVTLLRFMPLWQTIEPVQNPREKKDTRRKTCDFRTTMTDYILPLFKRMHEMVTDMPHEELTLCALCYRSFFFEGCFQAPQYRSWYAATDHTDAYLYLKKILQILQAEGPAPGKPIDSRWILKSPQHVDQLTVIQRAFPDVKLILTHRDPVRAVLSMITMMLYTRRQMYRPDQRIAEAHAWVDRLEQMLRHSQKQAALLPKNQLLNVYFDEFMAEPKRVIRQVLDFSNVDLDEKSEHAINRHLQEHTRDRHGRIDYRFEDVGLREDELKERFSFYQG